MSGNSGDVRCHCGSRVAFGFDGDPNHHRGMCARCDAVRCDAYPDACRRPTSTGGTTLWTALKIAVVAQLVGTERAVRYSDRLAAKGQ